MRETNKRETVILLERLKRKKPALVAFKFEADEALKARFDKIVKDAELTPQAVNDALNYMLRGLVVRLEREAKKLTGETAGSSSPAERARKPSQPSPTRTQRGESTTPLLEQSASKPAQENIG